MSAEQTARAGFWYALCAYTLWGLMPFFWKLLGHVDPVEVLAHRAVWSVPVAALAVWWIGRTNQIISTIKSPKRVGTLVLCSVLISVNWGVFIWAIAVERVLETALAYYINPLVTVALGFLFLGDRFDRLQLAAIALAAIAVLMLTIVGGAFPWLALLLAFTFGIYGYLRKTVDVGPNQGFLIETLAMFPPALIYLVWLSASQEMEFGSSMNGSVLLMLAGPATAVPLILYANGAKRLRLATIGLMQYMVPTMFFLQAVLIFGEPLKLVNLVAFGLIWLALALYTYSLLRREKATTFEHSKVVETDLQ